MFNLRMQFAAGGFRVVLQGAKHIWRVDLDWTSLGIVVMVGLGCSCCLYCFRCCCCCLTFIRSFSFIPTSFWSGEIVYSPLPFTGSSEILKLPFFSLLSLDLNVVDGWLSCLKWTLAFSILWRNSWIDFLRSEKTLLEIFGCLQGTFKAFRLACLKGVELSLEAICLKIFKPFRSWYTEGIFHTLSSCGWRDLSAPINCR